MITKDRVFYTCWLDRPDLHNGVKPVWSVPVGDKNRFCPICGYSKRWLVGYGSAVDTPFRTRYCGIHAVFVGHYLNMSPPSSGLRHSVFDYSPRGFGRLTYKN